jgi:hypothetical protein
MPVWLAALIGLGPIIVPLVRRVVFGLGFGLVTYFAVSAVFDGLEAQVIAKIGESSASILTLLGMAKVDVAIKTVFSAIGIKLGFMGLNAAGNIVKPRWNWND